MSKTINLELTNGVAEVLYGILVDEVEDCVSVLKSRKILNKDGTHKKSRKYVSEYDQYILDKLEVSQTLYKYLEPQLDSFKEADHA